MATKRMLVDATHPEETRIVVTNGNRLEEFDFESAERRQLRGNIYLAKVTRVEPSLQAAFIEYGGNRHGFLAFSEIHPDYYQIPVSDREALMRDVEEEERALAKAEKDEEPAAQPSADDDAFEVSGENGAEPGEKAAKVDEIGDGDALEDLQERPRRTSRRYKIQEVIKRRQVLLVQVVKEERGNKGAALTTYLSLAGRYSVLMPNTARGGGISRKITSAADRKRLKEIAGDLEVPKGMGVILRTAGASRTKAEVKRDFEYLMRLWENVRTLTLESSAPCLVYEEGSLIKRTIRDLYNKDIAEVLVSGDHAYREAKDFMRMIMPSHAKNVQGYRDDAPIFSKYAVESQLDSMFHPQVTLPSGGYIVINPTEALVSIDVNSGRATKEHNIEDTALQTNLEASEEISRQLRLRDLAGLIVIDFIDMEEKRNNRAVERKLKDCLKNDRARIQVGHISHFGLMEMSRQRIRFGVLESSTHSCPTCSGTGLVRSVSSLALMIMRSIEDHLLRKAGMSINVRMPSDVALYILNTKRHTLALLEHKYAVTITISADNTMLGSQFVIEKGESRAIEVAAAVTHIRADAASMADYDAADDDIVEDEEEDEEAVEDAAPEAAEAAERADETADGGKRRRRRRRRGASGTEPAHAGQDAVASDDEADAGEETEMVSEGGGEAEPLSAEGDDEPRRRRRRGRRGGRRNKRGEQNGDIAPAGDEREASNAVSDDKARTAVEDSPAVESIGLDAVEGIVVASPADDTAEKPKRARRGRKPAKTAQEETAEVVSAAADLETGTEAAADAAPEDKPKKPRTPRKRTPKTSEPTEPSAAAAAAPAAVSEAVAEPVAADGQDAAADAGPGDIDRVAEDKKPAPRRARKALPSDEIVTSSSSQKDDEDDSKPKKVGWWQRGFFG